MNDVLDDILDTVELRAALYFWGEFRPPFGLRVPALENAARFHLNIVGECVVELADGQSVRLDAGDLVLVPNGAPHRILGTPDDPCMLLDDAYAVAGFTGDGPFLLGDGPPDAACQLICGHFGFAAGADHPLLHAVPELLHITAAERATQSLLDDLVGLISQRMIAGGAGAMASVTRLSEALFIEILRFAAAKHPMMTTMMRAITDPQIGHALRLIHNDIAKGWTVESLGSAVGMSRSRFAERFRELVGTTPMGYIAEWRLQRALRFLNVQRSSVKAVATQVGFQSAAAFTRAFTTRFGQSPTHRNRSPSDG
ncbi:MAG: AraC family transcriptional regulator [Sphingomonas sp.]|nr:AraC family transcriptional regulator [Sphingomonas sp.]